MAKINQTRGPKQVPDVQNFNPSMAPPYIKVKDLNTMIFQQGVRVRVYKTLWCPNRKSIDGAEHEVDCKLCRGSEFIDVKPIESFCFLQAQTKENQINPENVGYNYEEGISFGSFIGGVELSYYTKVELVDYAEEHKQLVQRQVTGTAFLGPFTPVSYSASTGILTIPDVIDAYLINVNDIFVDGSGARFPICGDITVEDGSKSFKIGKNKTVSLIAGATILRPNIDRLQYKAVDIVYLMDDNGITYDLNNDFVIDRNGDIQWLSGSGTRKPADKSIYTVLYYSNVAFRAIRAMHSNRYGTDNAQGTDATTIEYPQQWVLKKLFLFRKTDSESGQLLDANNIFPKD